MCAGEADDVLTDEDIDAILADVWEIAGVWPMWMYNADGDYIGTHSAEEPPAAGDTFEKGETYRILDVDTDVSAENTPIRFHVTVEPL